MGSYLYGCISTDSRNELAQARFSQFQERAVALDKLQTRFTAWVGTLPSKSLPRDPRWQRSTTFHCVSCMLWRGI